MIRALTSGATATVSLPSSVWIRSVSIVSLPTIRVCAARPLVRTSEPDRVTCTDVLLVRAVDDDSVRLCVAGAVDRGEVDVDRVDAGACQVVDGDRVDAAEGLDVDLLDAVEVHRDEAEVAGESSAAAVGGDVDVLRAVAAVEVELVDAGLAFHGVAAVAGVPLEAVFALAQERPVGALVAVDLVVAVAADDRVGAVAAGEDVGVVAAVDRQRGERCQVADAAIVSAPSLPSTIRLSTVVSNCAVPAATVVTSAPLAAIWIRSPAGVPV